MAGHLFRDNISTIKHLFEFGMKTFHHLLSTYIEGINKLFVLLSPTLHIHRPTAR